MYRQSMWKRRREQVRTESDHAEALKNEVKKDGADIQDRLNETVDTVLNCKKNKANKNTADMQIVLSSC